jgi:hypothetical protein
MTLHEFITFVTLRGWVTEHVELGKPDWDTEAEKYYGLSIQGRAYEATIRYAVLRDGRRAVINCSLTDYGYKSEIDGNYTMKLIANPKFEDIVKAFIPS